MNQLTVSKEDLDLVRQMTEGGKTVRGFVKKLEEMKGEKEVLAAELREVKEKLVLAEIEKNSLSVSVNALQSDNTDLTTKLASSTPPPPPPPVPKSSSSVPPPPPPVAVDLSRQFNESARKAIGALRGEDEDEITRHRTPLPRHVPQKVGPPPAKSGVVHVKRTEGTPAMFGRPSPVPTLPLPTVRPMTTVETDQTLLLEIPSEVDDKESPISLSIWKKMDRMAIFVVMGLILGLSGIGFVAYKCSGAGRNPDFVGVEAGYGIVDDESVSPTTQVVAPVAPDLEPLDTDAIKNIGQKLSFEKQFPGVNKAVDCLRITGNTPQEAGEAQDKCIKAFSERLIKK